MNHELKQYQEKAIKFVLDTKQCGLLMPTGTGKTVVALLCMKILNEKAIVIAPAHVKNVWFEQNKYFGLNLDMTDDLRSPGKIFVTSYDWIKNNVEVLLDYNIVILDEAKSIADTETERYRNLSEIIKSKERVVLLAGYPVENKLNEIFMLSLITDVLGKNYYHFLYKFFNVVRHNGRMIKTTPKPGAFDKIIELIAPFVFIVDKSEAVPNSVKKETVVIRYKLTDYQRGIINTIAEFGEYVDEKIHIRCSNQLSVFSKLMQIIDNFVYVPDDTHTSNTIDEQVPVVPVYFDGPNPKLETLIRVVKDKKNFLLWYCFDVGEEMLSQFKNRCRLIKIQTDSKGLNLQSFEFAIWFDVPLSGGMFLQGIDRIHRMGRTKDVISIVLVPEGIFGDKLLQMLDKKQRLTKRFISELLRVRV